MRLLIRVFQLTLLAAITLALWMGYALQRPLEINTTGQMLVLKHGGTLRSVAHQMTAESILHEPWSFMLLVRLTGKSGHIRAGNYQLTGTMAVLDLYEMLTSGDAVHDSITLIEGWNFNQIRAELNRNETIQHLTMPMTDAEILAQLGSTERVAEGLFFPDSYFFTDATSDMDILRRAYQSMQRKLETAWAERVPGLPYASPYEALIMASIIEKETGRSSERPMIARVFLNRIKLGMRLQTDPTVIYGMGTHFDGDLRRRDLLTDTPYNTYTRDGLPPTPIAMPGLASIEAALRPAAGQALYFVGKGDGSHIFSTTLSAHNRSVMRYQIGKGQ